MLCRRHALAAALAMGSLVLAGCERGVERASIEGRVTVNGAPLDYGSILFVPDGRGPKSGGAIRNGRYTIESNRGPFPGDMKVEIRAPLLPANTRLPDSESERFRLTAEAPERFPAIYNVNSKLRAQVTTAGPNEFDFDLKSK